MNEVLENLKEKMPPAGSFDEVYAFSAHKSGSTLMHKMIADVCRIEEIPAISIPDAMFLEGVSDKWQSDAEFGQLFTKGRIYYGFRNLPPFMSDSKFGLMNKRAVLLVRDPRDALVSQYFSLGGKHISHRLPNKNKEEYVERLKQTADLEIDAYVLRAANNLRGKLEAYRKCLGFEDVLLKRYEDIYFDKVLFLCEIFEHFQIAVDPNVLKSVAKDNDVRPVKEDIQKHIRKGLPGDHKEKLHPDTIAKLNAIFMDTCAFYGYDLSS